MTSKHQIICRLPEKDNQDACWGRFTAPCDILTTASVDNILPTLEAVEAYVADGKYAAGFLSYESAPAFDDAFCVNELPVSDDFPLIYFGIYDHPPEILTSFCVESPNPGDVCLSPQILPDEYLVTVEKVKRYIYEGDIYQANFTFRSISAEIADSYSLFCALMNDHPVPYGAYIDTGTFQIVSLSPELFLARTGNQLLSVPMKGTAPRALTASEDAAVPAKLANDPKNRAENLMIVDMVRNDLGRICKTGSVKVDPLFHVDTYSTLHQMISKVYGEISQDLSLSEILTATFPAASITGAPKVRAMEIIQELESSPRKLYTGSIGCLIPGMDFCFNVAIRTLICSQKGVELGIGSGIVADSVPEDEWDESLLKSTFVSKSPVEFSLLETILFKEGKFVLLDEHLERMRSSQLYFGRIWNAESIYNALYSAVNALDETAKYAKIRVLLDRAGDVNVEITPLKGEGWGKDVISFYVSEERTCSGDLFLYHKTTNREFYNTKYREALEKGVDEVLFMNERGEITEGAISNVFIRKKGEWITPPVKCGLLPGVQRAELIREMNASEQIIYLDDLQSADEIIFCNSLRGVAGGTTDRH